MSSDESSIKDTRVEIRRIKAKISQIKGLLTRTAKFANEQRDQVLLDTEGIQLRLEMLRTCLGDYKQLSLELQLLLGQDAEQYFAEDLVEDRCVTLMAELRRITNNAHDKPPATPKAHSQPGHSDCHTKKLPHLELPVFDGKEITQYASFIDIFNAIVDSDFKLMPVEKLCYLRKYLKGDALTLIERLPLVNESYKSALDLLSKRYNNKCLLISHHVHALLDLEPISRGTARDLRHLVSIARQNLGALKGLNQSIEHWDMIVIPILLRKLDVHSCRAYHAERDQTQLPTLEHFLTFLEKRATSFEESQLCNGKATSFNKIPKSANLVAKVKETNTLCCRYCKEEHKIYTCKKFQALSTQERLDFIDNAKLCKVCLNLHANKCRFHFRCNFCKSKSHNSLLHLEDDMACNVAKTNIVSIPKKMVLLPTIKVRIKANNNSFITARGIVDSGSQISFAKTSLINKLGYQPFNHCVNVTALGLNRKPVTRAVNLSLHSIHSNYNCNSLFSVVDNITGFLPQARFDLKDVQIPDTIKLADNDYNSPGEIDFLVSADIFFQILLPDKIELARGDLVLLSTKFGYILSGNIKSENICLQCKDNNDQVFLHANVIDDSLDTILQRFWEEQKLPEATAAAYTDPCEIEFQNSVQLTNNRFQVKLPLKIPVDEIDLGDSFSIALHRLNALCRKFSKNPNLKQGYSNFIKEYLEQGHAKIIDLFKLEKPLHQCYFLPHHAVLKEGNSTTRLRVVFDASAHSAGNHSLNNILHTGPVVQKDLFDILVLFRTYRYVAMTDIKAMFRQVLIDPSQAHLQLILWKENLNQPLLCLQLLTVTYGLTCSSFLATRCVAELAYKYYEQFPLAASAISNNMYVDDCLFGASSIEQVIQVRDELIRLTSLGSFELHKWCANDPAVLRGLPENKLHSQDLSNFNNFEQTVKALGLLFNMKGDYFIISSPKGQLPQQWTKRTVLSFIGSFFDPLGLAGPIVMRAKVFLQKVWLENLDWDTPLASNLIDSWNLFVTDLMNMTPIHVKRDLLITNADKVDLVGYCDASTIGYGACIYIRVLHGNNVEVSLLCSKSRIAPMKSKPTMPKLELNSCLLLAQLYAKIQPILGKCQCHFDNKILFSDSQIALCWLQNPPKENYVHSRVSKVIELSKDCVWSHVSGLCNPADCLSRGVMPTELAPNVLWWNGPKELKKVIQNYIPFNSSINNVLYEEPLVTRTEVNCNVNVELIPVSKFSSLNKLQRVMCYVMRFISNCKVKRQFRNTSEQFAASEYRQAMSILSRFRAKNAKQLMAALPQDRVVQDKPFNKVGIDFCGPFSMKQSTLRRSVITKGYVCVIVCLVTKAVHLELVSDLTTDNFLSAFKRFCSRRNYPSTVICDNASTFRSANTKLHELYKLSKSKEHKDLVSDFCSQKGIEFKFVPSYSPSFNGISEAGVKSFKYHFKRVIGKLLLTYEQFNTIIVQVEAVLNSRPITQLSNDMSDFSFLTPGHFLVNRPLTAVPEPILTDENINTMRFWKKCTKVQQSFWQVWHRSYMSQIINRPKWHKLSSNIKEGVLVLLIGDNSPPLQWPVARVVKVYHGNDGNVRVVKVRKSNGHCHNRVVNKIAVLPIYE